MSKSLGTVVRPLDVADVYGLDAFRYYLVRDMVTGRNAEFKVERVSHRYHGDLANDPGNLAHRRVNTVERYCAARLPEPGELTDQESALRDRCLALVDPTFRRIEALATHDALAGIMEAVGEINRYLERTAPWKLAKAGELGRVRTILYTAAAALRLRSVLLQPVLPDRMAEPWRRLGWQATDTLRDALTWGVLEPDAPVIAGSPLFPRDVESVVRD
jgi:methionyl-tRNA synthetase